MTTTKPFAKLLAEHDAPPMTAGDCDLIGMKPHYQTPKEVKPDLRRYREKITRLEAQLRMKNKLLRKLTAENEELNTLVTNLFNVSTEVIRESSDRSSGNNKVSFWRRLWPGGKR